MSNKNRLVSIIITTFNRNTYLRQCLESLNNQTFKNIEILLIDDGSKPSISAQNKQISNKFSKCIYFYKQNTGQPDSRNYGIRRARGKYIGFCDDDDFWALNKVEKQISMFTANPEAFVVNCCIQYVDINGQLTGKIKCHKGHNSGNLFIDFLSRNRTASITPLLKKEVFDKVGYFNPAFNIAEDWEYWRRVSYYYNFYFINEDLAFVRLHNTNMSILRKGELYEGFFLYRKLTKSLLKWGDSIFNKTVIRKINEVEWNNYRLLFINHMPGYINKIIFILNLLLKKPDEGIYLTYLIFKFKILRW